MVPKISKIIFVCTGNTCRSPMAEIIAKNQFNNSIKIISRGIFVSLPAKANDKAREVVKSYGMSLDEHRSKGFDVREVDEETLVLTMTEQHKEAILYRYPYIQQQVVTLYEYIQEKGIVEDPYGGSIKIYEECFKQLEELIGKIREKVEEEK